MARTIEVTDLILRDAHQSLIATRMAMDDMIPVLHDLDEAGYWSLECWGGATFDSCIRFLNEDPWERLRTFKKHMPKTPLQMLLRGQNLLGYRHYGDDVVDRFVDKAAENGMDVFRIFDALNDLRNLERAIGAVRKTGKHAQGTVSYTVSPIHTIDAYVDQAKRMQDMGVDSICIKDMAALIKPQAAYDLVKGIKEACGADMKVHLHVHATTGVTLVSLMKAVEAGVDIVDTAVSSMSLGTGHNPTEAFCEMLEGTGFETKIDLDHVEVAKRHFAKIRQRYAEFMTSFQGVETSIFKSQIPGGMLSNMESQLKAQGAGDKLEEVLLEVPKVRKDAGYPPLVTPSSQIVGTQAVFNVLMGRYKKMTGEFQDLMLGYYGHTTGDFNDDVVKLAQEQAKKEPITTRPADLIEPEFDELRTKAKTLDGFNGSDEDVLTYALFPQVAPKFFSTRSEGPKNLGKDPVVASKAPPKAAAPAAPAAPTGGPRDYTISVNGQAYNVSVVPGAGGAPQVASAAPVAAAPAAPAPAAGSGEPMTAELAGNVLRLVVQPGAKVEADQTILVLEAMKMETEIAAPKAGTLVSFAVKEGDAVQVGDVLAHIG
ncbi:MAG: methylmalonyl-CoA carboxytransferase subunit 5S [Planctomycetota bacterium]|jgi:methylmalonyl-CoA carboxyltransferase 5S subunit|nr:methylmalonyl-CoA carboxytransferase subunit 5S [Planctomycetota bacterium]